MILVDPDHAPTMRELMTHTAGFSYGDWRHAGRRHVQKLNIRQRRTFRR